MATLERAIQIATEAHEGQVDKGGAPYILHPLRVMLEMSDDVDRIAAVLHDALEDGPAFIRRKIEAAGFPAAAMIALDALTRRSGETYSDFIDRLKPIAIARRVKLADMRDNMDLSRIPNPTEKDHARVAKYARYLEILAA